MLKIRRTLKKVLTTGILPDMPFVDAQRTYMFNLFLLVACPFAVVSLLINIQWQAWIPALFNLGQIIIFLIGFRISQTQKGKRFRGLLLLSLCGIAIAAAYLYKNGSEYRLPVMMLAGLVLFEKFWQYMLFSILLIAAFVTLRISNIPYEVFEATDGGILAAAMKIFLPLLVFVLCLYYFKDSYFTTLARLEKAIDEVSREKEQKQRILNAVAHDLRNPILNITGVSKLMHQETNLTDEQRVFLGMIDQSTTASLTLINDLLEHQEQQPAANHVLSATNLVGLLRKWSPILQLRAAEKNIHIVLESCDPLIQVELNAARMERVISNLVHNAIKFSPDGSEILITTGIQEKEAYITVQDRGIGIPASQLSTLFVRSGNTGRSGTAGEASYGLGLPICKEIIAEHKGTIAVHSAEGSGTVFRITLPLYQSA
jgi:signal transduction histidine kinase